MDPRFFNFINPALDYVDSGKFFRQPFKWLYYLVGIATFVFPYLFIKFLVDWGKHMNAGGIICSIILILVWLAIAYVVCLLWFKRANKLKFDNQEGQRFIAIPLISNFVQVMGEAAGVIIGIGGFITVLIALIFNNHEISYVLPAAGQGAMLILFPIYGYLCVVGFRFLAESFLAIANIANNTEAIDKNIKKIADR